MDYDKIFYNETFTNTPKTWACFKKGLTGSFATALCHAWELGDLENRRRLELAFPHLFNAARAWAYSDNPDEYLETLMKREENGTE